MNPQSHLAQELVEYIISFLYDSPRDWLACALVSRSWVHITQSHIFRCLSLRNPSSTRRRWAQFQEALNLSPHLLFHVHQLDIDDLGLSTDTFSAICNFPFTHLNGASVSFSYLAGPHMLAVQQLLSLPTLCRVRLNCRNKQPCAFSSIWNRCSPSMRHLELIHDQKYREWLSPTQSSPSICLQSLRLKLPVRTVAASDWLKQTMYPFALSDLKTLSVFTSTEVLGTETFVPALRTIRFLDLMADFTKPRLDLSSLPSLKLLRISQFAGAWPWVFDTLSSITPSNRVSKIVIVGNLDGTTPKQFDSQLSSLPTSPIIEFELGESAYAHMIPKLPLLRSKNMLSRANPKLQWFEIGLLG
ncbi:hypothetical protein C8R44DRAFT_791839 [Mycena epipterygia]|nr:hypothetical protein C8R44DRAFT_791839 [Mycena epipterygia]